MPMGCVKRPACCPVPGSLVQGLSPGVPRGGHGQSSAEQWLPLGQAPRVGPAGIVSFAQVCDP